MNGNVVTGFSPSQAGLKPGATSISAVNVAAYTIPTASPESDGTAEWDATTLVVVHLTAAGQTGFGYTYADRATATLIHDRFIDVLRGRDPMAIDSIWADELRGSAASRRVPSTA